MSDLVDLPFATLCHGDPKDLPWPPYTFKRDIEAGSSDKLQSRDDQADQFSALADSKSASDSHCTEIIHS